MLPPHAPPPAARAHRPVSDAAHLLHEQRRVVLAQPNRADVDSVKHGSNNDIVAVKKPEPKVVTEVCSLCGLDWKRHGKEPTAETCIGLLLDEVRTLTARPAPAPYVWPWPWGYYPPVVPYRQPVPWNGPVWTAHLTIYSAASSTGNAATFAPGPSGATPRPVLSAA